MRFLRVQPAFKGRKVSNSSTRKLLLQKNWLWFAIAENVLGWKIKFQAQNYTVQFFYSYKIIISFKSKDIHKLGGD